MIATTFPVKVDGVGAFTFRRRTIADEMRIDALWAELTGGIERVPLRLDQLASAVATYEVLVVGHPEGWAPRDVRGMDAVMDDRVADLLRIYGALSVREDEFRPDAQKRFKAPGQGGGADLRDVVQAEVQPAADRPAVPVGDA